MTGRRLTSILLARGIRGLLIAPVPASRGHLTLDWSQFAAATCGYSLWRPNISRACGDTFQTIAMSLRELKRLGYRRIGLATRAGDDERSNHLVLAAMLAYQHNVKPANRVPLLLTKHLNEPTFTKWFRRHSPDAVLGPGRGMIPWMHACGKRVPTDVGFVQLQSTEHTKGCAGIHSNARLIGSAAIDLVVGQLQRNELGIPSSSKVVLIAGEWIDGPTVRGQM